MEFRNWLEASAAARGIAKPSIKNSDYGYWLSPDGKLCPVYYQGHEEKAVQIIQGNFPPKTIKNIEKEYDLDNADMENYHLRFSKFLLNHNWIRIITTFTIMAIKPLTIQQRNTILEFFKNKNLTRFRVRIPGIDTYIDSFEELFNLIHK